MKSVFKETTTTLKKNRYCLRYSQSPTKQNHHVPNVVQTSIDAQIVKTGFNPNTFRYNSQLDDSFRRGDLHHARQLYDQIPLKNTFSTNFMISGYVNSGNIIEAKKVFDAMAERTIVSWTTMIGGFVRVGEVREAVKLFGDTLRLGTKVDYVIFATLLSGFKEVEMKNELFQVHACVVKMGFDSNLIVCNALVGSYCKIQRLDLARRVFRRMDKRDSVTFNALMTGFAKEGLNIDAIDLFCEMQHLGVNPSDFTFSAILSAAGGLDDLILGLQIHGLSVKASFVHNVFVANALLDFYSKQNMVIEATELFSEMSQVDGVSYNVIITAYAWDGQVQKSIDLFRKLQITTFDRSQFPYSTMLSIASSTKNLQLGRQIHSHVIVTTANLETQVGNSLVDMYAKCSRFNEAKIIFKALTRKSTVAWTSIISGYVLNGLYEEGLKMFIDMRRASVVADQATYATILKASASLTSVSLGRQLHSSVIRTGFMSNVHSGSALLDSYAKCGSMRDAIQTFEEMSERNIVSWNALICAHSQNGDAEATLRSFRDMTSSGYHPNSVSFLSVLVACSHCGLVEEGLQYFKSMTQIYQLAPKREHYASMVDVLCRYGRFDEAQQLMSEMPFDADEIMWQSVLSCCRIHKNHELAKKAADKLFSMKELRDAAPYLTMSNLYASNGEWENVRRIKMAMRERGVKRDPAYSWVEIKHKIHVFAASDKCHPQMDKILEKIDTLAKQMEIEGYRPDASCSHHNVEEEMKIESLKYHSERLAIVFALVSTPEGTPIVVMKNLRACTDCHAAIKVISKIVQREITVRDSSRFHHFKNGLCSCGDYW